MSYASDVKKELTQLEVDSEHARSELAALLRMNGLINLSNRQLVLNVQTENAAIARRIYSLLTNFFNIVPEILIRRKMKLKKNNIYIVQIQDDVEGLLKEMNIFGDHFINPHISPEIMGNDQRKRSYLRGAFLAGGSVNNPETSSYHLEIYSDHKQHNDDIVTMLNSFNLNARAIDRRNGYIAYLKEAEKISEFLTLVGATNAMLHFEDIRIWRDMTNSVNRLMNCDNANLNKTVNAASQQLENIRYLDERIGLGELPDKLQEVAQVRLENPDASLKELGQLLPSGQVSKSGVNHRLRRINQMAEKLRTQGSL
ncbi:sporulation regulator WhiA [Aerococcus urinaehominis]|uniref:Probable cell division protein WhiA n=1 Tax=Aerococcus urinaehominis TaxID=128944 RepID=A0A0X8FLB9_9LACT|nr:DNA-binding protein WhiA [Aerococcus urinaehominis]AMB99438.1 sporulation regulator WhiA [Aerococcus urinaehominis]SDM28998.1 hypothetical protein SAMN04487985_11126 [Aerococcus urinaehominis]